MNDYSFGNYISTLRMRLGLSQYQLGVLVGVTDKAVSKWENGAAKPGMKRCQELAKVLGVTVNELLSCEYDSLREDRKDLFAMKRQIWKKAQERLNIVYGEKIPLKIRNRFEYEKVNIGEHDIVIWYDFLGKLRSCLHEIGEDFVLLGEFHSSFTSWLLGASDINPLPAHYYCPECKKIEFVTDNEDGYDLPEKYCDCGAKLARDGHNITVGNVFPLKSPHLVIEISENAANKAAELLRAYFKEYACVVEAIIDENQEGFHSTDLKLQQYLILDKTENQKYPTGEWKASFDEYCDKEAFSQSIYFRLHNKKRSLQKQREEYADKFLQGNKDKIKQLISMLSVQEELSLSSFVSYVDGLTSLSFYELVKLVGLLQGSGTWEENAELLLESGRTIKEVISFREEVYDYLNERITAFCGESSHGIAFRIKDNVRRGRYYSKGIPDETKEILEQCGVPKWYMDSMEKIRYLLPKENIIAKLHEL